MEIHVISDNSGAVIEAKDAAVRRAMEAIGIHLEGETMDELENSPRSVDTGRLRSGVSRKAEIAPFFFSESLWSGYLDNRRNCDKISG